MAALYGVNATKFSQTNPAAFIQPGDQGGKVKCIYDTYELTADLAVNDTIDMGAPIPKGARVVDVHMVWDALTAGNLDVGYAASAEVDAAGTALEAAVADAFIDGEAVTNAGSTSMQTDHSAEAGMYKEFAAAVQAQVKVETDTEATSGTIHLAIYYILD